jgi:hypothetical protein
VVNVLGLGEPRRLFANGDVPNLAREYVLEARNAVQQLPPDELLNTPTDDIVARFVDKYSFMSPILRRDGAYIDGPHEIDLRRKDFGEEITVRGKLIALVVPFDGEGGMFYMNPNRWGLVPLNGYFEGAAAGETFNAEGKTDILIRVDGRNIFIAECKIWRGSQYLMEAIDQLFSYMTWRDTKSAITVFNRNKNFSAVLASIKETVGAHPQRKHGPRVEGETRFRYVFGHPKDSSREIIVTILAFDVPS